MVIFYELRVILVIEPSTPLKLKSFDTFKDRPSRHSYYGSGCFSLVHTALPPIPIPTVRWFSTLYLSKSPYSPFSPLNWYHRNLSFMEALSPANGLKLQLPALNSRHARTFFTQFVSVPRRRSSSVLKNGRVRALAKNPGIDFCDPEWKSKFQKDFEKRFYIPHITDVFDDAVAIPSTFCLKSRWFSSLYFLPGVFGFFFFWALCFYLRAVMIFVGLVACLNGERLCVFSMIPGNSSTFWTYHKDSMTIL